jgi:hypothetical protein
VTGDSDSGRPRVFAFASAGIAIDSAVRQSNAANAMALNRVR